MSANPNKRARVCTFEPLHENMFEDAFARAARAGEVPSVRELINGNDTYEAYFKYRKNQTIRAVPARIIKRMLIPYMRDADRIALAVECGFPPRSGFYIGVGTDCTPVIITGVPAKLPAPTRAGTIPDWVKVPYEDGMEIIAPGFFPVPLGAGPEEIERLFWIFVFDRVFESPLWYSAA